MKFPEPLKTGKLIKRYKRFLTDVELDDGQIVTMHCPNTGSMKNCAEPGYQVLYSTTDNPKRKYQHTWELALTDRGHYIGVNTGNANKLVKEAIEAGKVAELQGYEEVRSEVKYGKENSRIDLLLTDPELPDCYVEVKSVTLLEAPVTRGLGYFPDAVSDRGRKHLRELIDVVESGARGVLMFCVQHSGIKSVHPARHIDEAYTETLVEAVNAGVEVLAYRCRMSATGITLAKALPFSLEP